MNEDEQIQLKKELLYGCRRFVKEKTQQLEVAMKAARDAGNDETKSSTGDKHETGKAMMQLEQEKIGIQLGEMQQLYKILDGIPIVLSKSKITAGSVVLTNHGMFYISVAAGKISFDNLSFIAISGLSPLGQLFLNTSIGLVVEFRSTYYTIIEAF